MGIDNIFDPLVYSLADCLVFNSWPVWAKGLPTLSHGSFINTALYWVSRI